MEKNLLNLISSLNSESFSKEERAVLRDSLQKSLKPEEIMQSYSNLLLLCLKHDCLQKYDSYFRDYATAIVEKIDNLQEGLEQTDILLSKTQQLGALLTQNNVDSIIFGGLTTRLFNPNCVERPHGDIDFKVNATQVSGFLQCLDQVFKIDKVCDRRLGYSQIEDQASRSGKLGIPRVKTMLVQTEDGQRIDLFLYTRNEEGTYCDFGVKPIPNDNNEIEMRGFSRTNPNQDTSFVVEDITTYSPEKLFDSKFSMITQGKAFREKDFVDLYNLSQVVDYTKLTEVMQASGEAVKGEFVEEPDGNNHLSDAEYEKNNFNAVPFAINHDDVVKVADTSTFSDSMEME